jgi:hypothetical protein
MVWPGRNPAIVICGEASTSSVFGLILIRSGAGRAAPPQALTYSPTTPATTPPVTDGRKPAEERSS